MEIKLKNIYKSFGEKHVLENISMTFNEGITCIMGSSGRGKTTLVNIIAGLIEQDAGTVSRCEKTKVSYVFQDDRLLDWETALSNVLFVANPSKDYTKKARQLLIQAGLSDSIDIKASKLSGGMRRRVCLCRALIADYDVLILDEPFKGLDEGLKPKIMSMVKEHANENKIVICITHDYSEADFLGGTLVEL